MIVEDDLYIAEAITEVLEMEGYEVLKAENGQVALDLLNSTSALPSLILLDLMMPVKDGIQFRAEQTQIPKIADIPILLMSADAHLEIKRQNMGVEKALKKPFDMDVLVQNVNQMIDS